MKKIEVRCQEGICPLCGEKFETTGQVRHVESNQTLVQWECDCGSFGWQSMTESFDGFHCDVIDPYGEAIEILSPQKDGKEESVVYIVLSTINDIDNPRYNEIHGCFSILGAAQACMLDVAKNSNYFDLGKPYSQDDMCMLSYDENAPWDERPEDWQKIEIIPAPLKAVFLA